MEEGVAVAKLNLDFYCGEDIYCDGSIEDEILEYYRDKKDLDLYREDTFYVTNDIRENIINWYPFKKGAIALEIGGGMGPITGAICDKCEKVISVENSKKRATILYERHKDRDNLEVYAANIKDVKLKDKVDYVILIGVFEYSKIFFNTANPFADFLNYLKDLIKPDGKILIAIENRYGIKYFSGVTEDHYSKPFVGIKGYENLEIQTLGLGEWKELLKKCGITNYKFYYPFPDYKMPSMIFSDNYLPHYTQTNKLPIFNYAKENYIFDYRIMLNGILENGMFDFFSNSYFIEIAKTDVQLSNVSFSKIQNKRDRKYKTKTIIYDDKKIYKYPVYNQYVESLKSLEKTHNKLSKLKIKSSNTVFKDNRLEIEFIDGELVSDYIYKLYMARKKDDIVNLLNKYYEYLKTISKLQQMKNPLSDIFNELYKESTYVLKYGLLDLNLSNIILNDNSFVLIDQEFGVDKDVPLDYVMFFSLKILYEQIPELDKLLSKEEVFMMYGITDEKKEKLVQAAMDAFGKLKYFDENVNKYVSEHEEVNLFLENYQAEKQELENLRVENKRLKSELDNLNTLYNCVVSSKSWRYTSPIRKFLGH